jgi:hypothetical protein
MALGEVFCGFCIDLLVSSESDWMEQKSKVLLGSNVQIMKGDVENVLATR